MVELRAAGYPASSLMLAVAYQRRIGLHTVLVVRTQMGDYVLDNMSWAVKPWSKVKYSWLSVQSPDDPSRWHRLS
jgi:predicted transglutaminase-like cysteine proteinase